jgi:aminoglycoside 2''-phosphotransferase
MTDETLTTAALAAFADANPSEAVERVETITRGWDSLALLVNGHWLLRVARRPEVGVTLALEARLLPVIAEAVAPVQVPQFRFTRLESGPAVVGYEVIRGQPLTSDAIAEPARAVAIASQLGRFLTALHGIPAERVAGVGLEPATAADWRAEYVEFRDWSRMEAAPLLEPGLAERLERFWSDELDDGANFAFQPVLVHRDLAPEHVLVTEDGALAGVIDWGDAALGDPAIDFAGFLHDLGEAFARQAIASWDGPRAADETGETLLARAWFYARLAPLHGVRFGLMTGQEDYVRNGVQGLRRNLPNPNQP